MFEYIQKEKDDEILKINKSFAYCRNHPIHTPADVMANPLIGLSPLTWQYKRHTQRKWYRAHSIGHIRSICNKKKNKTTQDILNLREFLLTFGGEEVCITKNEEHTLNILSRGQLWFGDRVLVKRGSFRDCHKNSAHLWSFNEKSSLIATGFVLTSDGIWKRHSWLVLRSYPSNKIIDVSAEYSLYFGYIMTKSECNEFYWDNY